MLVSLRRGPAAPSPGDVVDQLLDCHRRIRHFTALAVALGDVGAAPPAEVAAAAAGVARYFGEALPLHTADEEASILPRLLALSPPEPLGGALSAMTHQHRALEETLASALPRWSAVAADPACLAAHAATLRALAAGLVTGWDPHLGLEESTIFPAIRALLPASEQDAIKVEMRARRP